jgi:diketogulonate reductase-like aldo/keto reductase
LTFEVLRWHSQRGVIPVPRSSNLVHQKSNKAIFDFKLTDQEIQAINQLSKPDGRVDGQDPNEYEEFE